MSANRPIPDSGIRVSGQILDQAIDWTLKMRFNTPDEKTRQEFKAWLEGDSRNQAVWQQLQTAHQGFDILPGSDIADIFETVEEKKRARGMTRRNAIKLGLFGGICLCSAGLASKYRIFGLCRSVTAGTPVGGRRTLNLSEGTVVELNTDTTVTTDFTFRQRRIRLLRGEIQITTGKDTDSPFKRPFIVRTPFGPIEALGTKFCVRIMPQSARVCVLEDVVKISTADNSVLARKGETFEFNTQRISQVTAPCPRAADWLDGIIVAKRMPLSKLLGELSRYKPEKLSWDSRAADLKVSGIYQVHDPDKALAILSQTLPITLVPQTGNAIYISCSQK